MRIVCPFCGSRDVQEFSYLGDASLSNRPQAAVEELAGGADAVAWQDYLYLRANEAGDHQELWYHAAGCRQWLKVKRNLRTHEISAVEAMRKDADGEGV